jgi:hypothetical protein
MIGKCEFGHEIRTDVFTVVSLPRLDDDGDVVTDRRTGLVVKQDRKLPFHIAPRSAFDPTGLVPALCEHGLAEHPHGLTRKVGRSWVKSRYVNGDGRLGTIGKCVVCLGEPQPEDFVG